MPVGCLGVSSRSGAADSSLYLNQADSAGDKVETMVENIEIMQQRLLIQLMRLPEACRGAPQLPCDTCEPLTELCCQADSGWSVMAELVRLNSEAMWCPDLVRAVNSLRFQGWVCPGYLVIAGPSESLAAVETSWAAHSLQPPDNFRILSVGLSQSCSLKPFKQSPSPSLQDAICVVLSRLKMAGTVANMENIVSRLNTDYSEIPVPKDFINLIHKTLGALIKARKVYYTGKGYFLVMPETKGPTEVWGELYKSFYGRHGSGGESSGADYVSASGGGPQNHSMSETNGFNSRPGEVNGSKSSPMQSLSAIYNPGTGPRLSPSSPGMNQTPNINSRTRNPNHYGENPNNISIGSTDSESHSSPNSHLERSQSFKMSRRVQRTLAKGGSLRLSKKEAKDLKEETDNSKNEEAEDEMEDESPKKMERKGSVLGRLFGRKKSNPSPKKEILTFSAQFPPPHLLESLKKARSLQESSSMETQTPPSVKKKPSLPARPPLASPEELKLRLPATPGSPMTPSGVRNGPSGNFVVFERGGSRGPSASPSLRQSPLSPSLSGRPLPQSPSQAPASEASYGMTGHIYSQVQPQYGVTKPPPPAYSHAPPYRGREGTPPLPPTPASPQKQRTGMSQPKQVHFAATPRSQDRVSPLTRSSPSARSGTGSSDGGSSSVSGPSSMESSPALYDDTLAGIERSNQELEQRLGTQRQLEKSHKRNVQPRVDTIHNIQHHPPEIIFEEGSMGSRSSSVSTLKPDYHPHGSLRVGGPADLLPDHPSLADMGSIADLSGKFQSLTARKLMAGLSITSIDTLLEVNTAHENKLSILNESTETIDFGVI